MPVKKRSAPATQLSLEAVPPPAGGSKGSRQKAAGPKARGSGAPRKQRPHPAKGGGPAAIELAAAVRALEQVAEGLHFTHESFLESLLRLPRAEDFDPLADVLRPLAAAAPAWLASRPPVARDATAPLPGGGERNLAEARAAVQTARDHLERALLSLPDASSYEPTARNLRAMASVSPSLLEWLREVPALAAPLGESVGGLQQAVLELDRALEALEGRGDAVSPLASRVKVVVRT